MAQSLPFLGRLEPFYGWYKRVICHLSAPENINSKNITPTLLFDFKTQRNNFEKQKLESRNLKVET
jgi:hypothetical protein